MVKVKEIIKYLDNKYPEDLRSVWDFTDGFLEGDLNLEVKKMYVSVELNQELINKNPKCIILHHPPKFGKDKKIINPFYSKLKHATTIYILHSRIDKSGDINCAIAQFLFEEYKIDEILEDGTVVITLNKEHKMDEIIRLIKEKLNLNCLKVIEKKDNIKRIAIHGGEGFNDHHVDKAAEKGIDLYLAGDLSHHLAEHAFFYHFNFVDIEHISEQIGMKKLCEELNSKFGVGTFEYVHSISYWCLK